MSFLVAWNTSGVWSEPCCSGYHIKEHDPVKNEFGGTFHSVPETQR